jgi:hypothetical protein
MPKSSAELAEENRAATRKLVQSVVVAQGNIFIRDLLRRKKIPIGISKEEFEDNLLQAIEADQIGLADVTAWLDEVEGWGEQSVYLYNVPKAIAANPIWSSAEGVKKKLTPAQRKLWNVDSLAFPDKWELTAISFDGSSLRYVWHQRLETLLRRKDKDRREVIEGETYEFRAFLVRDDRAVLRFFFQPQKRMAAVFMQIPAEGDAHESALGMVRDEIKPLVDLDALKSFFASNVIKNLDQAALDNETAAKVKSKKTRLADASNYVEFANTSGGDGYSQSAAVRAVRRAVKPGSFAGSTGIFLYTARTPTDAERFVTVEIFGEERRIKLRAQLKASEVWDILDLLRKYE